MKCIIIDDEEMARTMTGILAGNNPRIDLKGSFSSALEGIKYLNENHIDLVFLDIHMPQFNGIDFIQTIKDSPLIILTTSDSDFALQAFEYPKIIDYLLKPINQDRFDKGVEKAFLRATHSTPTYDSPVPDETSEDLYININHRLVKIDIPTITVIKAHGDYILLKTDKECYTVHTTLKKLEDKLPADTFLKVHRSFVINTKKIIDFEDNSLLVGKEVIPVSRSNRAELIKRLNLL